MFFQGTLQEGISTALQQSKQVVCFVTGTPHLEANQSVMSHLLTRWADDGGEGTQWETEFLADGSVKGTLRSQAVTLRLQAGSEEAGYLEALFPVPRKPTVVVIQYVEPSFPSPSAGR